MLMLGRVKIPRLRHRPSNYPHQLAIVRPKEFVELQPHVVGEVVMVFIHIFRRVFGRIMDLEL